MSFHHDLERYQSMPDWIRGDSPSRLGRFWRRLTQGAMPLAERDPLTQSMCDDMDQVVRVMLPVAVALLPVALGLLPSVATEAQAGLVAVCITLMVCGGLRILWSFRGF